MSIQSEINRLSGNVTNALAAIASKGVTVPSSANSNDLADLIYLIDGGGGGGISGTPAWLWEDIDEYLHLSYVYPDSEPTLISETLIFIADAAVVGTAIVGESRVG